MPRPGARVRPHAGAGRRSWSAAGRAWRRSPRRASAATGRCGTAGSRRAAGGGPSGTGRRPRTARALAAYVRLQARRQAWGHAERPSSGGAGRERARTARHCEDWSRESSPRRVVGCPLALGSAPGWPTPPARRRPESPPLVHIRRGRREGLRPLALQHDRAASAIRPRGAKAPSRMAWRFGELRLKWRRIQCFGLGTDGSPRRRLCRSHLPSERNGQRKAVVAPTGFEPVFQP